MGPHFPRPGLFDIRDEVCLAIGGFRHGQVVVDNDGDQAVVVGVRFDDEDADLPKLWFRCDGNEGAGVYSQYHLLRKEFKVVGSRQLQEVLPSDPIFENQGRQKSRMEELLTGLLKQENEGRHDRLGSDFEFDYTFSYLMKSLNGLNVALFDIRDEVCMPVGGFKHGDVVKCGGSTMVVIGVRPDRTGTSHQLWVHVDGCSPGACICEHPEFIRMVGEVVGKRKVEEYKDPVPTSFSPEFIQGLQPTFRFPIGARGRTRIGLFDIRDEVCLHVGGCKHGERLKDGGLEMVAIGVAMDDGVPEMFLRVLKPKQSPGAGTFERLKMMLPFMKSLGQAAVQEASEDIPERGSMFLSTSEEAVDICRSGRDTESGSGSDISVDQETSEPMPCRVSEADEGQVSGHAVLLSLSHTGSKVKDALLLAENLADCRKDVVDAGCEVTPTWANGAVLLMPLTQMQAQEAQLELRPHHIVAFNGDKDRILAALQTLPCRSRPKIRAEVGLPKRKAARVWEPDVDLVLTVDRTFLTCIPAAPSEASVMESAPCGDVNSTQPENPRKRGN